MQHSARKIHALCSNCHRFTSICFIYLSLSLFFFLSLPLPILLSFLPPFLLSLSSPFLLLNSLLSFSLPSSFFLFPLPSSFPPIFFSFAPSNFPRTWPPSRRPGLWLCIYGVNCDLWLIRAPFALFKSPPPLNSLKTKLFKNDLFSVFLCHMT